MNNPMLLTLGIVVGLLTLWLIVGPVIFRAIERREFNKGYCTECGEKLRCFAQDSSGALGWCCDNCQNVIWISWLDTEEEIIKTDENGNIC